MSGCVGLHAGGPVRERVLTLAVLLSAAAAALAASSFDSTVGAISGAEWIATVLLSAGGGVVMLFLRIGKSQSAAVRRAAGEPYDPSDIIGANKWVYGAAHMGGAILAGVLALFVSLGQPMLASNWHLVAGAIIIAALGGAKGLERYGADRIVASREITAAPTKRGEGAS